jgi:predicted CXXCH cytochrome family protein
MDEKGVLLPAARAKILLTCDKCHSTIFNEYATSVHGKGVLEDNNPDVPTCTTCHGVHNIANPTTAAFRNSSIQLCAICHTSKLVMDKYNLSTQVLNTYVVDFHGTTVTLFARQSPGEMSNKPAATTAMAFIISPWSMTRKTGWK